VVRQAIPDTFFPWLVSALQRSTTSDHDPGTLSQIKLFQIPDMTRGKFLDLVNQQRQLYPFRYVPP